MDPLLPVVREAAYKSVQHKQATEPWNVQYMQTSSMKQTRQYPPSHNKSNTGGM